MTGDSEMDLLIRGVRDLMLRGTGELRFERELGAFVY